MKLIEGSEICEKNEEEEELACKFALFPWLSIPICCVLTRNREQNGFHTWRILALGKYKNVYQMLFIDFVCLLSKISKIYGILSF